MTINAIRTRCRRSLYEEYHDDAAVSSKTEQQKQNDEKIIRIAVIAKYFSRDTAIDKKNEQDIGNTLHNPITTTCVLNSSSL